MTERRAWQSLFFREGRARSLWRILLFLNLFVAFGLGGLLLLQFGGIREAALFTQLFWQGAVLLAASLAAGWLVLIWLDERPGGALGFAWTARVPRELWLGILIGGGSLAIVVVGLVATGSIVYEAGSGSLAGHLRFLAVSLVVFGVAAAGEEALFRGYAFQALVEGAGPVTATVLSSIVFSAVHLINPNIGWFALFNIFLAGVLFAVAYLRTRSLWFATSLHLGWNWALGSIFALPVSGWEVRPELYRASVPGADWATGGEFGPEGGVAATLAFLIALGAVLWWPGLNERPELRAQRPLVDGRLAGGVWDR